ncbi:MAG: heme biosynthesis HemY N-terminal domain-containing protein [Gammaproteobacteria bacterium]
MRISLLLLFVGMLGLLGAHFLVDERGQVLIHYFGTNFETSVPGLLMLLLGAYLFVRILVHVLRAPMQFGEAVGKQRQARAKRKMNQGMIELAEGNWAKSERLLSQGARAGETPLLNYLNAARAAQLQGEHERRDNWLTLAYEQDKDAANAVLLTQAQLQFDHEQFEEALATLQRVNDNKPGHRQALALLASIYSRLGDFKALRELLPQLKKKKAMNAEALAAITRRAYAESIRETGKTGDQEALKALWSSTPAAVQKQGDVLHAYIDALTDSSQAAAAEKTLRQALGAQWDTELVRDYGLLEGPNASKQLSTAESWLKSHPNDAVLLLTTARLAMRNELWGKARSYLESSLSMNPRVEGYQLYGHLLEKMGESEGASIAFRNGLSLATGQDTPPALPDARGDEDELKPDPA